MLDIETLTDLPTAEVAVLHPLTGAPTGAYLTLIGPEHPHRRELEFRQARRVRSRLIGEKAEPDDENAARTDWIDQLAACTLGWRGIRENGQDIPFSAEAARDLYDRLGWLREQAGRALNKRELFIGGSASASSPGPAENSN